MKILLVNQKSPRNRGDHAIYIESLRVIEEAFPGSCVTMTFSDAVAGQAAFPAYTIISSLDSWAVAVDSSGKEYVTSPLQRLADIIRLILFVIEHRLTKRRRRWFFDAEKQAFINACASADLVLGCGGGYLYDEDAPPSHIAGEVISFVAWHAFVLGELLVPLALGKPLILLPQSIGPLRTRLKQSIIAWIVRKAKVTFVRERESLKLLNSLGCGKRAIYFPDLAFGFASHDQECAKRLLEGAGLDRSRYAFCVGMTAIDWGAQQPGFRGQEAYEQSLIACINAIIDQGGAVVLFAQCATPLPAWDDRVINRRLRSAARCPAHVYLVEESAEPDLLQAAYSLMDYFIATRMHSAILAINAGVPVITIGYLHKSRGIMRELGLAQWCFDIESVTPTDLVQGFISLYRASKQDQAQRYVSFAMRAKKALVPLLQMIAHHCHG